MLSNDNLESVDSPPIGSALMPRLNISTNFLQYKDLVCCFRTENSFAPPIFAAEENRTERLQNRFIPADLGINSFKKREITKYRVL